MQKGVKNAQKVMVLIIMNVLNVQVIATIAKLKMRNYIVLNAKVVIELIMKDYAH
jgi:hypothetical protein